MLQQTRALTVDLTNGSQRPVWPITARDFPLQYGSGAGPALVLLFSDYTSALWQPLNGVERASGRLADAFDAAGFATTLGLNLSVDEVRETLAEFAHQSAKANQAMLYCSGHGLLIGATQYVIPVDADLAEAASLGDALRWDELAAANHARTGLAIWGGCRDNPLNWST